MRERERGIKERLWEGKERGTLRKALKKGGNGRASVERGVLKTTTGNSKHVP